MRTQSIGIQMPMVDNGAAAGKEKSSNEFDFVLGMNLSAIRNDQEVVGKRADSNLNKEQSISGKSSEVKAELFQGNKLHNVDQTAASKEADTTVQDENEPMVNSLGEIVDEEDIIDNITDVIESIVGMLLNVLNLSEEELKNVMEEHNINPEDLLNTEGIQQLLLALNGESDMSLFLTNETLNNQWKDLVDSIEEIIQSSDLNLSMEEVKQFLLKMNTEVTDEVEIIPVKEETTMDHQIESQSIVLKEEESIPKVEVETGESSEMKNQQNGFEGIVENLVQQTTSMEVDGNGNLVQVTQMRDIVNQIVEQIKVVVKPDMTSMTMQLNPENLGKIQLSVQAQNGVMTAQFVAQNDVVKEALESQIHLLKENLNEQGLKVEEIEVTVLATPFEQRQEQDTAHQSDGSPKKTKITLEQAFVMEDELNEEVEEDQRMVGPVGGQIDYNA